MKKLSFHLGTHPALPLGFALLLLCGIPLYAATDSTNPIPLRVSELMYKAAENTEQSIPQDEGDFIELQNVCPTPVNLADFAITSGVDFDFATSAIAVLQPGEFVVVVEDLTAFQQLYPDFASRQIAGQFSGNLSNSGEEITIEQKSTGEELKVSYASTRNWPIAADGAGHSLVPLVTSGQEGLLKHPANWRASTFIGGSPGLADPVPARFLIINEIAPHTDFSDPALPEYDSNDWIELLNLSRTNVFLDDWFLSDSADNLQKYALPDGTTLPASGESANGYLVSEETSGFHFPITSGFGINKLGEAVYLSHFPPDGPGRIVDAVAFKSIESNRSWGRFPNAGPYWQNMVSSRSTDNVEPVADVVITEVMYHPTDNDDNLEFVELFNPTPFDLPLFDFSGPWQLKGNVEMTFPENITLMASEYILLVPFDPLADPVALNTFNTAYGLSPGSVRMLGPWTGGLPNSTGRVTIEKAEEADVGGQENGEIVVDEILYLDRAPWYSDADGNGDSLQRSQINFVGNDPAGWGAIPPTPGARGLNPLTLAITDMQHPISKPGEVSLTFPSEPGATYAIEVSLGLEAPFWSPLSMSEATSESTTMVLDSSTFGVNQLMFRVQRQP